MKVFIIALSLLSLNAQAAEYLRNISCSGDGVTVQITDTKIIATRNGETLFNEALAVVSKSELNGWRNIPSVYIHGLSSKKPKFNFEVQTLMNGSSRNINSGTDSRKFHSGFLKIGGVLDGVKFRMVSCTPAVHY